MNPDSNGNNNTANNRSQECRGFHRERRRRDFIKFRGRRGRKGRHYERTNNRYGDFSKFRGIDERSGRSHYQQLDYETGSGNRGTQSLNGSREESVGNGREQNRRSFRDNSDFVRYNNTYERPDRNPFKKNMELGADKVNNKESWKFDNKSKELGKDNISEFRENDKDSPDKTDCQKGPEINTNSSKPRKSRGERRKKKRNERKDEYQNDDITDFPNLRDNCEHFEKNTSHFEIEKAKNADLSNLEEEAKLAAGNNKEGFKLKGSMEDNNTLTDINIKKENIDPPKEDSKPLTTCDLKKEQQKSSSSSSSSSSTSTSSTSDSDSEDSDVANLKRRVKRNLLGEKTTQKASNVSSLAVKKAISDTSSSSSSSSSDSDLEEKNAKQKKTSEDDVIYLGNVQNVETVIDDEDEKICLLCDKKGHTSFSCQMICKNCGAQYHGLKNCPKPANLSIVLQSFMEFCLNQCVQYNPEQNFIFKDIALRPNNTYSTQDFEQVTRTLPKDKRKRKRDSTARTSYHNTDSSYSRSSSEEIVTKKKAPSRRRSMNAAYNNSEHAFPSSAPIPFPNPFPSLPLSFNPQPLLNTLMPYTQLMGFNPTVNFPSNLKKGS